MSKELQELFYNPDEEDDLGFNNKKSKELPFMGIIGQACTFMSCELEWNKPLQPDESLADSITEIGKKLPLGLGEELTDGLTNSDLKNSMVMSALKLCIPGVVYNLNKYRQVDCEYLECLKVYSASGLDVSQCDVMKASKTCSIIVGEVFEIPYVRIGKNLFSNMADVVRMSFGTGLVEVLKLFSDSDVCKSSESDTAIILCNVPYALNQYISGQKKTSMSKEFTYDSSRDFCQTAGCVGPDCYPSNSLFGIPVPQYVPTKEQKLQMDVYRRFGGLSEYTYLIVNAHGSQNPEIRKRNIEEWNIKVQDYNKKYSKNYPQIPLEAAQFNDNSQLIISSYFNNFNEKDGVNNDDKKEKDKFYKINQVDPRTKYDSAKQEARAMFLKIQSNPFIHRTKDKVGL
ncbi:MAG: hypothetical protein KatS3mg002_0969 [Candidatus Woesearchaeota archaeon]|nr:MAG: hypothetical protein KatS3mg002_0969 [Candidatus Woesearchaeota archaeon]